MASQFQHRLVGAVIVIALGVIILPNVLDGKKKYYQDQFAAIPLVPKADDRPPMDMLPPVTQALTEVDIASIDPLAGADTSAASLNEPTTIGTTASGSVPVTGGAATTGAVATASSTTTSAGTTAQQPVRTTETTATSQTIRDKPPVGEAYVIQLAALSNAARVNELVAQLTLANYRVYTLPTTPVQGKVTRIFIGPEISKQKLEASLPELKKLTGLNGMVRSYSAIR